MSEDRREEIIRELRRLTKVAQGLQIRYGAYFDLHKAAIQFGDKDELQSVRDNLHTVLDVLLDNGEQIARLSAEAETLS